MHRHTQHWPSYRFLGTRVLGVLSFNEHTEQFSVQSSTQSISQPVRVMRIWSSPFAVCLRYIYTPYSNQRVQHITLWRHTLPTASWRYLQLYLGRYQLQYQFSDLKGE